MCTKSSGISHFHKFLGTFKVHRPRRGQKGKRRTGQGKGQSTLPAKRSRAEKDDYVWSKDPTPVTVEPFLGSPGPTRYISDDPMTTFSSFFTGELLMTIVEETNRYAAQFASRQPSSNQREWKTSIDELKVYFGFMILMGINQLPEIRDYWAKDPSLHYSPIADRIARDRFEEIARYLHFVDNDVLPARGDEGYHRLQKILPIVTAINKACIDNYRPNRENSIDEAMIPFKGRSSLKQYVPLKPVKRGFKVWVRADSWNGYFCEFEVYTGKADTTTDHGLGERVVHKLTSNISGLNHQVFCDRFFTSIDLFSSLLQQKVYACGTILTTRRNFPVDLRGVSLEKGKFLFRQTGSIVATVWMDKKIVSALSTMSDPDISHPVKRKQKDGSTLIVDCPSSIVAYNTYMGGVDRGDQLRSYYHVRLKSRKFYKYVFWFLFDVVVTNSYILSRYAITTNPAPISKQSLKNFRLKLASQLIGGYCSRVRLGRRRLHPLPPQPSTGEPSQQRALLSHLPHKAKSTRCLYCCKIRRPTQRRETVWYCPGCEGQPHLCLSGLDDGSDCYSLWHSSQH